MAETNRHVQELISAIMREYPTALISEVADAFMLGEACVRNHVMRSGVPPRKRGVQRKKDQVLIRRIKIFADEKMGGMVEIIPLRNEAPALCINSRMVA